MEQVRQQDTRDFSNAGSGFFQRGVSQVEKAVFFEHLGNLIDGGVTVLQALRSFLEKTDNPTMQGEISNLLIFLESGDLMSIGMKKLPRSFDRREWAIVEAGEQSGTLSKSFISLSEELRSQEELRQKVVASLTYPGIIMAFLLAAVFVIMTYVIPKIRPLFENSDTELPASTQALISSSEFVQNHWMLIIALWVIWFFSLKAYSNTTWGRRIVDEWAIHIPVIGQIYRNFLIVRIASTFGLLLGAGIPIIRTFQLTAEGANNLLVHDTIDRICENIQRGHKISESIDLADPEYVIFTRDFTQLIAAGEKTSTLNTVCHRIARQYEREVDRSLSNFVKFVEPFAIFVAGVFVLWFAFGIFSAVLKVVETVH